MTEGIRTAIIAAVAGGLVTAVISFIKYINDKIILKNAMKIGLYFEIEHHNITYLHNDSDGQPNFSIAGFQDHFYKSNIASIVKSLDLDLTMRLSFYYAKMSLAKEFQDILFAKNDKIQKLLYEEIKDARKKKMYEDLIADHNALKDMARVCVAPCIKNRAQLLDGLKEGLQNDPSKVKFIDVPDEYKDWWAKRLK